MDRFQGKNWPASLLITIAFSALVLYLAACTPAAGVGGAQAAPPTGTKARIDQVATQAAQTIEAVLQATTAATATPVATPTPPRPTSDHAPAKDDRAATPTAISAVINLLVVGPKTVEALIAESAATDIPTLTPTLNAPATATAEEQRIVIALAATLAAQPTATSTTDSPATATAEMAKLALAVAATLTAQPTTTPTPLPTATGTATPDLAATATADAQRMATAVAATLTAQPTATGTATPTATATPDFTAYIRHYRAAERAVLQTLSPDVLAQMPVFAHGEALATLQQQVEALRAADQYQVLVVENIQIEQVLIGETIGVLATERHNLQTFARAQDGDRLLENQVSEMKVVYGFVFDDNRWKIEKVRVVGASQ